MSMRPYSSVVASTSESMSSSSVTSVGTTSASPPADSIRSARASSSSARRAASATLAPASASASAVASPIPDDAPVTIATSPASRCELWSSSVWDHAKPRCRLTAEPPIQPKRLETSVELTRTREWLPRRSRREGGRCVRVRPPVSPTVERRPSSLGAGDSDAAAADTSSLSASSAVEHRRGES